MIRRKFMRALIQRVIKANVKVDGKVISEIDKGLLIFICAMLHDDEKNVEKMASKISKIRIFNDDNSKMNKSIIDISGKALIVSQFTLSADTSRGNRPGFSSAATPEIGEKLYNNFIDYFGNLGIVCFSGIFGADMKVGLVNDGPITVWLNNDNKTF